jgi:hypothetical protein
MVVFKHSPALINQPTAHILRKISDVCLIGSQGEFVLYPSVSILSRQDSVLPDQVECPMCPDSKLAQISVCKCAFGDLGTFVHSYISIALWVMLTYIQLLATRVVAVYIRRITQHSGTATIRTSNGSFFHFHNLTPIKQKWYALACTCSNNILSKNKAFVELFKKIFAQIRTKMV